MKPFKRVFRRDSGFCAVVALAAGGVWSADASAATLPLISTATGQCAGVYNGSTDKGAAVVQSACTTAASQRWTFVPMGVAFQLVAQHSGKCLVLSSGSKTDGVAIVQGDCKKNDQQGTFDFRPIGRGYEVVSRHTGKCLALEGTDPQSGARIVQQTCNRSAMQVWATGTSPAAMSAWTAPKALSLVPVSAAHLPDGKLLLWSARDRMAFGGDEGRTYTSVFDPATSTAVETLVTNTGHDMFCPGIANLPDGKIHVSGGSSSQKTSIYDPATGKWIAGDPMNIARGYQGSVTLSNGSVLTYGGSWSGGTGGKDGEVWTADGGWRRVANLLDDTILTADARGVYRSDNHGWFFAAANGRVFHAGPSRAMHWLDTAGAGTVTAVGQRSTADAMNGNAVMYDTGRILTTGGAPSYEGTPATKEARLIDLNKGAAVRGVAPMAYARAFHSSVVLPNGQVVVVGGQAVPRVFTEDLSVLTPELWDPRTETFTPLAATSVPRVYHSVAMLLPDGRVFSGGGGLCGSCTTNHPDSQILTPPYLLNPDGTAAVRPKILAVPTLAALGTLLSVTTDTKVSSFAMVRMSSITHSVNNEQRRVPLATQSLGDTVHVVTLPSDPGVAVPGYWMLFGLSPNGVPSKATIIRIG